MAAAYAFIEDIKSKYRDGSTLRGAAIRCTLKGSLAFTGKGHATDRAVALGLHGHLPAALADQPVEQVSARVWASQTLTLTDDLLIRFDPKTGIVFDQGEALPEHPNGMIFDLIGADNALLQSQTYFSIGGGFIKTRAEMAQQQALPGKGSCRFPFDSAAAMLEMAKASGLSIAEMKRMNELEYRSDAALREGVDKIWDCMNACVERGLHAEGVLPGGLRIARRAKGLYDGIKLHPDKANLNDWLCAYAMAVNEENAAGHVVVTAPTNGAAGVIPAVLSFLVRHEQATQPQVRTFLLTASAIGGLIKHRSSISGAQVGCQGEVGTAAAMAAAGLCGLRGGTPQQVENAAEIALEHHLGMTCDPVKGLVQVPCIERNGFGAIKAYTAASLALRGSGEHFMPLDSCIEAMKQTGLEMSHKYKETALGGLAVSIAAC